MPFFLWLPLLVLLTLSPLHALSSQQHQRRRVNLGKVSDRSHADRSSTSLSSDIAFHEYEPMDDDDKHLPFADTVDEKKSKRKLIQISSQIVLPFSAEVAYEAYSNLPRQPSWSTWLEQVDILNGGVHTDQKVSSKWTSKVMGIRYSWTAEAVRNERPHTLQWKSITGLRNEGIVRFYPKKGGSYREGPTLMTLRMAFVTPRAVTLILRNSKRLTKFVEEKMIAQSLVDFRDVVLNDDVEVEQLNANPSTVR